MFAGNVSLRRMIPAAVGVGLLAGIAAATYVADVDRPSPRDPDLANFRLVDAAGRAYSVESFPPGSVLAIYFGYTTCLKACPIALDNIAVAMDALGAQGDSVRPVFVDMDPERVALASLPLYMQSYGPRFLGLTGPPASLEDAARSFKIRVERLRFSADPADYAMTHASPIFVMRPSDPRPLSLPPTSAPEALEAAFRNALRTEPLS